MNIPTHQTTRVKGMLLWGTLIFTALLLSGCQEVFTYSLFEGMQRDPSSLPPEQQISLAKNALANNDKDLMEDLYDEIVAIAADDPEQYALAAQIAMSLSGVTDVIEEAGTSGTSSDIEALAESLDTAMLANVATNVENAVAAGVTVEPSVYIAAAGAELLEYLSGVGDDTIPDPSTWDGNASAELDNAWDYLVAAGEDPTSLYESLQP